MPFSSTLRAITARALHPRLDPGLLDFALSQLAEALKVRCALFRLAPNGALILLGSYDAPSEATLPPDLVAMVRTGGVATAETLPFVSEPVQALAAALPGETAARGILLVWRDAHQPFADTETMLMHATAGLLSMVLSRRDAEQALHESEVRAQAILDTAVDAIITIDTRAIVHSFNQAAEKIFGYRASEVIGQNIAMLMPEPYHSEHDGYIERYHATGQRHIIGIGREVTGRRKDGSVFPMYLAVSEVHLPDRTLYTGLVRDITQQRHLEQEVLRISDEERRRIGQDLHDGLGQMLTGVGLIATNLARRMKRQEAPEAGQVQELADMIREADAYARSLARGLVPVELEQGGLRGALERLCDHARRLFGIACTYVERGEPITVTPEQAMHLYRIAQEAVSNAVRHGKAAEVGIMLDAVPGYLRLRVRDDGSGFSGLPADRPPEALGALQGMGLRIMHYRARMIGAALEVQSAPGEGTAVTCTLRRTGETPARAIEPQMAYPQPPSD